MPLENKMFKKFPDLLPKNFC